MTPNIIAFLSLVCLLGFLFNLALALMFIRTEKRICPHIDSNGKSPLIPFLQRGKRDISAGTFLYPPLEKGGRGDLERGKTTQRPERINCFNLPLFFALGAGIWTFCGMLLCMAGLKLSGVQFAVLLLVVASIDVILYFKTGKPALAQLVYCGDSKKRWGRFIGFLAVILLPLLLGLLLSIAFPQFDIDMLGHILIKGKIFTSETYQTSVFLRDEMFANMHSRYPPFTAVFLGAFCLFGCASIAAYQVLNYFILFLTALALYGYLKEKIPQWQTFCWLFIFISSLPYISSQFIIDSTDVLLSLYFLLAVLWLVRFYHSRSSLDLLLCFLLTGLSTLVKNEALPFSIMIIILLCLAGKKQALQYLWIWIIIALPWIIYRGSLPEASSSPETMLATMNILDSAKYIPDALRLVFSVLLRQWNAFFLLFPIAAVIALRTKHKKDVLIFSTVALWLLLVYTVIIWLHIGKEKEMLFYCNGFYKILSHIYPFAVICVSLTARYLQEHK